jgi:nitrogen fixation/metabolism regulation signal transduction histidine kinase
MFWADKRAKITGFQFRWLLVVSAAVVLALGLVLLFLLTQATDNRQLYEQNYSQLFGLNVVVAALLMGVILWLAARLILRFRQGKFGSRLLLKIAATFALVGLFPGLLIYSVSYQFVSRSIESWFDVKVEGALDAGLSLGRATLDTLANDLGQKTRNASVQISDLPDASAGVALDRLRDQLGADDAILWSLSGQALASAGESRFKINPTRPTSAQIRQIKTQGTVTLIEGLEDASTQGTAQARIRAWVVVAPAGLGLMD